MRTGEEFDLGPLRWESIVSRHSKTGFRFITGVSILNSLWNMQSGRKHVIGDWFIYSLQWRQDTLVLIFWNFYKTDLEDHLFSFCFS